MSVEPVRLLYAGATFHIAIAAFHVAFRRLFRWDDELPRLSSLNRGIMRTLNACLIAVFFGIAFVEIHFANAMLTTGLGRAMIAGIATLWLLRALLQVLYFEGRARNSPVPYVICFAAAGLHFAALA